MSLKFRIGCGAFCGMIMGLCVIMTIRIADNESIGSFFFKQIGFEKYYPQKLTLVVLLFLFWWLWGRCMKNIDAIWINWARICFSALLFIATISFIFFN